MAGSTSPIVFCSSRRAQRGACGVRADGRTLSRAAKRGSPGRLSTDARGSFGEEGVEMTGRYLEDFAVGQIFRSGPLAGPRGAHQDLCRRVRPPAVPSRRARRAGHDLRRPGRQRLAHRRDDHAAAGRERFQTQPAASWAPASTSSAGRGPCGPGTSCASRPRSSRCGRRGRVLIRECSRSERRRSTSDDEAVQVTIGNLVVPRRPK